MPTQWSEAEQVPLVCIAPKASQSSRRGHREKISLAASVSESRAQLAVNLFDRKVVRLFARSFYIAKNLPFTATTASRQKSRLTVANTATTFFSLQPHISKWWCRGAILNTRLPWVSLK